jgi:16S rRNA (guanine527-N7)-methyltransferase
MVPEFVKEQAERLGLEVPTELWALLERYLDALLSANERFNLTGVRERDEAWRRHIVDSLTLLPLLDETPQGARVVDVGSGAGLPGIPLAICRGDLAVTLVDSTGKKARFMEEVSAELGLSHTRVLNERAEVLGQRRGEREAYDVATCRALGPLPEVLEYTLPLLRVGGELLAMKGPSVEGELEGAGDALQILGGGELEVLDAYPEGFDLRTVLVRVTKARPTPRMYPRPPGQPRHEPLGGEADR